MATTVEQPRGGALTTLAVLMGLLAISNIVKPVAQTLHPNGFGFRLEPVGDFHFSPGFVFCGQRLHGLANAIMSPLFGLLLAAYAYGAWKKKRWVLPLAVVYAGYVVLNLVLFSLNPPPGPPPPPLLPYAVVAIGVSSGGALYLYRHRAELR
jgi:hypothetical protein